MSENNHKNEISHQLHYNSTYTTQNHLYSSQETKSFAENVILENVSEENRMSSPRQMFVGSSKNYINGVVPRINMLDIKIQRSMDVERTKTNQDTNRDSFKDMASVTDSYTNIQSNLNSSDIQTSNNRSEIKVDEVADNSLLIREITKDYNMGNNIGYSSN